MKGLVGAFNQEKALLLLLGAFSLIVKPMDRFTALVRSGTGLSMIRERPHQSTDINLSVNFFSLGSTLALPYLISG